MSSSGGGRRRIRDVSVSALALVVAIIVSGRTSVTALLRMLDSGKLQVIDSPRSPGIRIDCLIPQAACVLATGIQPSTRVHAEAQIH